MGRQPCCEKVGIKRGAWTAEEDAKLINFILSSNGQYSCWRDVPKLAGLLRCGKSCRLRWTNYLRPDVKRGLLSDHEEMMVIRLHAQLGNRWSKIASHLPGRTDNEIKNHWNTHIKKKLKKMGIDPLTHKPLPPPRAAESPLEPPPVAEEDQNKLKAADLLNPTEEIEPTSTEPTISQSAIYKKTDEHKTLKFDQTVESFNNDMIFISNEIPSSSSSFSSGMIGNLDFSPDVGGSFSEIMDDYIWYDEFNGWDFLASHDEIVAVDIEDHSWNFGLL